MSRNDDLFLKDMAQACDKVVRFVSGDSREQFFVDEKTYDAVLRNLEVIGEAAKHVSEEVRVNLPGIDWRKWLASATSWRMSTSGLTKISFGISS